MGAEARQAEAYAELCAYTLTRGDPQFIHQHVVDAHAAQYADENSKPIAVAFALIGLYLHVECGRSGRDVQRVHVRLAGRRRAWPRFDLPATRGEMTPLDVMSAAPGSRRDEAIHRWCESVWQAWHGSREQVVALLAAERRSSA